MQHYTRVLFLDPKRRNDFGGWAIVEGAAEVERVWPREHARVIARPALLEDERAWMDRLCRRAYYVAHCVLAADELPDGVTADRTVPWLDVCLKRGREAPLTTIVATQRPLDVPKPIRTEAEHVFAFDLNDPDDRRYLGKLIGGYWSPRADHGFLYWTPLTRARECAAI